MQLLETFSLLPSHSSTSFPWADSNYSSSEHTPRKTASINGAVSYLLDKLILKTAFSKHSCLVKVTHTHTPVFQSLGRICPVIATPAKPCSTQWYAILKQYYPMAVVWLLTFWLTPAKVRWSLHLENTLLRSLSSSIDFQRACLAATIRSSGASQRSWWQYFARWPWSMLLS